jgi:hypothetical protein
MKRALPSVAVVWMYQGKDPAVRRLEIERFDYPDFQVFEVGKDRAWARAVKAVPERVDVCVFWIDDGKPVGKDFLREMIQPLANKDLHAVMHYWSGNAFSIPRHMLDAFSLTQDNPATVPSLLQLLLPVLDAAEPRPSARIHLAFSSTERLAPLTVDVPGFVS